MTHPSAPRDVDLTEWLRSTGYLPADTDLKRLAHEAVRALVGELGAHFHYVLPAGADKTHTFRVLRDVLMWANATLAVGGGPDPERVTAGSLRALAAYRFGDLARPADPRVADGLDRLADALDIPAELHIRQTIQGDVPAGSTVIGYVSPFKSHGHDGDHHELRFNPPLDVAELRVAALPITVPDDPAEASEWLDAINAAVNAKHPGVGWSPAPDTADDGKDYDRLMEALCLGVPESWDGEESADYIIVSYVREIERRLRERGGSTERWNEELTVDPAVTPPADPGGMPDEAPTDTDPWTLWLPAEPGSSIGVGVTQGRGFVGLTVATTDAALARAIGGAAEANTPHFFDGRYGFGVAYDSTSSLNVVLEALSAAGGRAFVGE